MMSYYGLLVDVSGSMQKALTINDIKVSDENITRGQAVFETIFKIIKQNKGKYSDNENENEKLFALAFGLSDASNQHCDLISLFEYLLSSHDMKANDVVSCDEKAISSADETTIYDTLINCLNMLKQFVVEQQCIKYIRMQNGNEVPKINRNTLASKIKNCRITGHEPLIKIVEKYIKQNKGTPNCSEYFTKYLSKDEAGYLFHQFHCHPQLIPVMVDELP
eukprot:53521_1